jgi:glycerol-3-phosphate O-acyltransferase / dihydroxyacetone phosphate acyltransferase
MPLTALSQYTTPILPPENPWIQRQITSNELKPSVVPSTSTASVNSSPNSSTQSKEKTRRRRKPPTRQVMRHILRARAEAVRALVSFFAQLEKESAEERRVRACYHLAKLYGTVESDKEVWRNAREVISFLRKRGAGVKGLENSISIEGEWAAAERDGTMSSDWEETSDTGSGSPSGLDSRSRSRSGGLGVGSSNVAGENPVWIPLSPLAK